MSIKINADWQLGADEVQWILRKRRKSKEKWDPVSFVSSTKDILARCMREKGVPDDDARCVLETLPDTFKEWRRLNAAEAPESIDLGEDALEAR